MDPGGFFIVEELDFPEKREDMRINQSLPDLKQILKSVIVNKDFSDKNTTTEFLAYTVFQRLLTCIQQGDLGPSASSLDSMRITLHESHVAWAAYEGKINGDI